VLERDRFRCRGCGSKRWALVIHHRDGHNRTDLLVTSCIRCHVRIRHSLGLKYWFSTLLLRLWRELHPNEPMQLQLTFEKADKEASRKLFLKSDWKGTVTSALTETRQSRRGGNLPGLGPELHLSNHAGIILGLIQ
jgi:hypothetical protein